MSPKSMKHFCRISASGVAAALAVFCCPTAVHAQVLNKQVAVNVGAQKVSTALIELSKEADVQIVMPGNKLDGFGTNGVRGRMPLQEALRQLLEGTGFGFHQGSEDTITVDPPGTKAAASEVEPPAFAGVKQLSEIKVVAQAENTYVVSSSNSATRTDTDLLDTPQSVSVITRKLLDDQQVQTLSDALGNAGVQVNTSNVYGDQYTIRGFQSSAVMHDGLGGNVSPSFTPIWAVDSIEVLKGPESILSGAADSNSFGGAVNIIAKQPQTTPVAAAMFGIGSYGQAQAGFDAGGALSKNKAWSYRLVGQLDRSGSNAGGYDGGHGYYLAPSVRWSDGDTSVLVGAERTVERTPEYLATVMAGVDISQDPPLRVIGARDDGTSHYQTRSYYKFEQALSDSDWLFRSRGQYSDDEILINFWTRPGFIDPHSGLLAMAAEDLRQLARSYSIQNDITGKFSTGDFSHQVVFGGDFQYTRIDQQILARSVATFDALHSPPLPSVKSFPGSVYSFSQILPSSEIGYFLQDQISYGENWHAMVALRHALYHSYLRGDDSQQWLPNFGLVYKLTPDIAAYASAMRGYTPNTGLFTPGNTQVQPTTSRQYEAGFKFDLAGKRLFLTTAAYQIKVSNSPIGVPGTTLYSEGPGQTSKGVEVELKGHASPGLDLSTGLVHTIAKTSDGTPTRAVARNTLNFWAGYQFQRAALKNWGVGLGVFARSSVVMPHNYFDQEGRMFYMNNPGNVRVDAHIGYTGANWSINFGIRDLFDRRLYSVDASDLYAGIDAPGRTYMLTTKINLR